MDTPTKVVHCKKENYDVYIGRPSKWGNPFEIGKDGNRDEVIRKYEQWIMGEHKLLESIDELRGKVLGCWCAPKSCHGDVLAKLADGIFEDEVRVCCNCGSPLNDFEVIQCKSCEFSHSEIK